MAGDPKFYYRLSQITAILLVLLLLSQSSCARPLNHGVLASELSHNIVLLTGDNINLLHHQSPISMKVRRERVNLLLHRLPKGKKPVSGPSERTNSLND
ncbi:hypothetical protein A4A49_16537 [Nicotiana attenuata]|uniref:Uncharacterized protein n=1 Tax=Nicotiana attenuata TaxID=49451 RepID=A0A314KK99_NICAT|nr:hypothetical protein A4A49_16537 [Nicotiana attenuata]